MGSLSSQPPLPPPPQENSAGNYRVYASFCPREPTPGLTMSNWLESYNPSDNTWHRTSTMPGLREDQLLKGFAMVSIGNSVYVVGGRLCRKEHRSMNNNHDDERGSVVEVDLAVLPSVLRCDVVTGEWSTCAPLATPRFDFACAVCDGKIYVAGGQCGLSGARGTSSAEVYDPALDAWAPLPNMSTLRYKCVGVTWQGKIHVVGGFAEREDSDRTDPFVVERSSAEVFDTWRGEWDLVSGMWQLDIPPNQIVTADGRLFSSGDCLNTWKGHIEAYDGKLKIWNIVEGSHLDDLSSLIISDAANIGSPSSSSSLSSSSSSSSSVQRLYLTMAPIGTHLYFLAGYRLPGEAYRSGTTATMSVVHAFDTSTAGPDVWRSFEPVREEGDKELCSHCCVVQVS